jgi:hypothetical protein
MSGMNNSPKMPRAIAHAMLVGRPLPDNCDFVSVALPTNHSFAPIHHQIAALSQENRQGRSLPSQHPGQRELHMKRRGRLTTRDRVARWVGFLALAALLAMATLPITPHHHATTASNTTHWSSTWHG